MPIQIKIKISNYPTLRRRRCLPRSCSISYAWNIIRAGRKSRPRSLSIYHFVSLFKFRDYNVKGDLYLLIKEKEWRHYVLNIESIFYCNSMGEWQWGAGTVENNESISERAPTACEIDLTSCQQRKANGYQNGYYFFLFKIAFHLWLGTSTGIENFTDIDNFQRNLNISHSVRFLKWARYHWKGSFRNAFTENSIMKNREQRYAKSKTEKKYSWWERELLRR